jgi:hypothetical protein
VIIKIPEIVREGEVHFSMQYYSIAAKGVVTISRVLDIVRDLSFDVRLSLPHVLSFTASAGCAHGSRTVCGALTVQDGAKLAVDEQRNRMTSISVLRQVTNASRPLLADEPMGLAYLTRVLLLLPCVSKAIAHAAVHDWKEAQNLVAKQRRKIDHSFAKNAPLTRQYFDPHFAQLGSHTDV